MVSQCFSRALMSVASELCSRVVLIIPLGYAYKALFLALMVSFLII